MLTFHIKKNGLDVYFEQRMMNMYLCLVLYVICELTYTKPQYQYILIFTINIKLFNISFYIYQFVEEQHSINSTYLHPTCTCT